VSPDDGLKARVTDYFNTNQGNEGKLKELVVSHGAIISTVAAYEEFKAYTGGVFDGCRPEQKENHAILVVGYGTTKKGEDYWLIKNSWGVGWGEDGFMRLKRGVKMCNIGRWLAGVECAALSEDEDPYYYSEEKDDEDIDKNDVDDRKEPKETFSTSCTDTSSNCDTFPESFCQLPKGIAAHCPEYCNLC
jgi:Papain family cysteine protease